MGSLLTVFQFERSSKVDKLDVIEPEVREHNVSFATYTGHAQTTYISIGTSPQLSCLFNSPISAI
ncbi:hypothetical protein EON63_05990 [archaeon]|nr:MAG: hypothetical protein EON63_05990 [archaeon]